LSLSYEEAGLREAAVKLREEALSFWRIQLGPENPNTLKEMENLSEAYDQAGRHHDALRLRQETLVLCRKVLGPEHPDTVQTLNDIAWTMATSRAAELRNGTNAVNFANDAVAATHRTKPALLDTLAAAYAEAQQFEKAMAAEQEAIGLLRDDHDKRDYGSRLKLYQEKKPCRD